MSEQEFRLDAGTFFPPALQINVFQLCHAEDGEMAFLLPGPDVFLLQPEALRGGMTGLFVRTGLAVGH